MMGIYKVAVVEDDAVQSETLADMLKKYGDEHDLRFIVSVFDSVENFFVSYKKTFDIVFMDIELPGMNGLAGAHRLREYDSVVTLIFITHLAQYAVKGYEVYALDYIVKPLVYKSFSVKLDRIVAHTDRRTDKDIIVSNRNEMYRLPVREIVYVEVSGHHLFFHKTDGGVVEICGSLSDLTEQLRGHAFARCNSCYLLNMRHIDKITKLDVTMCNGETLSISRSKRKTFLDELALYFGEVIEK